jgi:hypothetical protein
MNRRKAVGSILGLTGIGFISLTGTKYFFGESLQKRGKLEAYIDLITELVDVLIPATTTSGAKAAQVQDYIIDYMENCSTSKEYNNFLIGLNDLQEASYGKFDCLFEKCSVEQKVELLEDFENNPYSKGILLKISNKIRGRSFYNILKSLTIEGYCTSYIGATEHLKYIAIPGEYLPITELKANQKAWATN